MSDANHIKAEADYSRGMKYREIAEKYDVTINTVKSWKQRYSWSRKGVHTKDKGVHTKSDKQKGATNKKIVVDVTVTDPVIENDELTEKQRLFCIYYIKYFNATKAYQKAYDCAYTTAMTNGNVLLRNTKVNAEIDRFKKEQSTELKLSISDIIQKYIDIAFTDISDYLTFGQREVPVMTMFGPMYEGKGKEKKPVTKIVNFVDFRDSGQVDGTLISEVKQGKDGASIKLNDRMKALKELEKYMDFMTTEQKLKIELLQAEVKKVGAGTVKEGLRIEVDYGDDEP